MTTDSEDTLPDIPINPILDGPMQEATEWRPPTPPTTDESNQAPQAQPLPLLGTPPGRPRQPPRPVRDDGEEEEGEWVWESFCWVFVPRERDGEGTVQHPSEGVGFVNLRPFTQADLVNTQVPTFNRPTASIRTFHAEFPLPQKYYHLWKDGVKIFDPAKFCKQKIPKVSREVEFFPRENLSRASHKGYYF